MRMSRSRYEGRKYAGASEEAASIRHRMNAVASSLWEYVPG